MNDMLRRELSRKIRAWLTRGGIAAEGCASTVSDPMDAHAPFCTIIIH